MNNTHTRTHTHTHTPLSFAKWVITEEQDRGGNSEMAGQHLIRQMIYIPKVLKQILHLLFGLRRRGEICFMCHIEYFFQSLIKTDFMCQVALTLSPKLIASYWRLKSRFQVLKLLAVVFIEQKELSVFVVDGLSRGFIHMWCVIMKEGTCDSFMCVYGAVRGRSLGRSIDWLIQVFMGLLNIIHTLMTR